MKKELEAQLAELSARFVSCKNILVAIGDETRQHVILEMLKADDCNGLRVEEIAQKANLSRPSVSHHLQVLKNAGIVQVRKEGTKNYYFFDIESDVLDSLLKIIQLADEILTALPDRREK